MEKQIIKILDNISDKIIGHYDESSTPGLLSGTGGISLFLFMYAHYKKSKYHYQIAWEILNKTINNIHLCTGHTWCSGISGICWLIDYLCIHKYINKQNQYISKELMPILEEQIITSINEGDFDFLHGSIGTAIYLISKNKKYIHQQIVNSLINKMVSIHPKQGYWKYYWSDLKKESRINISLSHGMASTCIYIIYLLNIYKFKNAIEILEKSLQYINSQSYNNNLRLSVFPTFNKEYDNVHQIQYSRLGWCYGDLGIALLYWSYHKYLQSNFYKNKAIELFKKSCQRKELGINKVSDGGLCHGTSGIGLIFYKMYLNTKIDKFRDTANYWLTETINFSQKEYGYNTTPKYNNHLSMLDGISGIGLFLLSIINKRYLGWEKTLLIQ